MLALRFFLLFLLACVVFLLIINVFFSSSRKNRVGPPHGHLDNEEEMVLDPQCQSYVPRSGAISSHEYYFCSEQCARLFVRTIERKDSKK